VLCSEAILPVMPLALPHPDFGRGGDVVIDGDFHEEVVEKVESCIFPWQTTKGGQELEEGGQRRRSTWRG